MEVKTREMAEQFKTPSKVLFSKQISFIMLLQGKKNIGGWGWGMGDREASE